MRLRRIGGRAGSWRRGVQPVVVPPVVQAALARARDLAARGDFSGAAAIYARLAQEAYARARPRPGVQMDLAAGYSWLQGGELAQAAAYARHALTFLLPLRRPGPALALVEQIAQAWLAQGNPAEAQRLQTEVAALLQSAGLPFAAPTAVPATAHLPAACPSCGAPLRPAELEWVEADRAACAYCGTIILTS